jgi:hypothetical protein
MLKNLLILTGVVLAFPATARTEFGLVIESDHDRICHQILDRADETAERYPHDVARGLRWMTLFQAEGCDQALLIQEMDIAQYTRYHGMHQ